MSKSKNLEYNSNEARIWGVRGLDMQIYTHEDINGNSNENQRGPLLGVSSFLLINILGELINKNKILPISLKISLTVTLQLKLKSISFFFLLFCLKSDRNKQRSCLSHLNFKYFIEKFMFLFDVFQKRSNPKK